MQTLTLPRTGDVPLQFEGEHLAGVSTQTGPGGQDRNRWFEIDLYRTEAGTYVLAISYMTLWQGEHITSRTILCESTEEVRNELRLYNPLQDVNGYPPGDAYQQKQERLERMLRLDWANAIKELFAETGDEFVERIA
jgi:hypothetical protein